MGMLKFEVAHTLSKDEARKRTESLLRYWSVKYGVQAAWSGDSATLSGKLMGMSLQGSLTVEAGKVGGEATDPGLLFRDKAKKYLTRKFGMYLDGSQELAAIEREDSA